MLSARIDEKLWDKLASAYAGMAGEKPAGLVNSYLLQDTGDREAWRIVTVWRDMAALQAMRSSGETPTGVLIFRAVGAEPELSIHQVAQSV